MGVSTLMLSATKLITDGPGRRGDKILLSDNYQVDLTSRC